MNQSTAKLINKFHAYKTAYGGGTKFTARQMRKDYVGMSEPKRRKAKALMMQFVKSIEGKLNAEKEESVKPNVPREADAEKSAGELNQVV